MTDPMKLGTLFDNIIPHRGDPLPDDTKCETCGYFDITDERVAAIVAVRDPNGTQHLLEAARCKCEKRERDKVIADGLRFRNANLPQGKEPKTFDNFIPRKGTEEMLEAAKAFAEGDGGGHRFLTITGLYGNGKSHIMEAMARKMLKHGAHVKYVLAKDFLDHLRSTYNKRNDEDFYDVLTEYRDVHALFLDDLGAEADTEYGMSQLTGLVESRIQNGARLAIATNLTREQMMDTNPRLASRVFATNPALGYTTKVVVNTATDYRK